MLQLSQYFHPLIAEIDDPIAHDARACVDSRFVVLVAQNRRIGYFNQLANIRGFGMTGEICPSIATDQSEIRFRLTIQEIDCELNSQTPSLQQDRLQRFRDDLNGAVVAWIAWHF